MKKWYELTYQLPIGEQLQVIVQEDKLGRVCNIHTSMFRSQLLSKFQGRQVYNTLEYIDSEIRELIKYSAL